MIKTLLLIVPHEDDELNMIGSVLDDFVKSHIVVDVLFVTNGDYSPDCTEQRFREAKKVAEKAGFRNLYFLGYPDNLSEKSESLSGHICYSHADAPFVTASGRNCTYCPAHETEYCYQKYGIHHPYTIDNVKADMKDCILSVRADMILCTDFDIHPDHRMTSLLFDDIIIEVVCETDYRPIILKKFLYAGVWYGPDDYYNDPMSPTVISERDYYPYSENAAIRAAVSKKNYPVIKSFSKLYRLCKIYETQKAVNHFTKMVNADTVFFFRNCNNLALSADVSVSSGNKEYINDNKLIDTEIISLPTDEIIKRKEQYTWSPEKDDPEKSICFHFNSPVNLKTILLHLPFDEPQRSFEIRITVNGRDTFDYSAETGLIRKIIFPDIILSVSLLEIKILNGCPECGFREIEIFEDNNDFPWEQVPIKQYLPDSSSSRPGSKFVYNCLNISELIKTFCKYELKTNGLKYYFVKLLHKFIKKAE